MNLAQLEIGKDAIIQSVECSDAALRKHILDMGLTKGTEITLVKVAPMGDPLEIRIRGYELTLRKEDAGYIQLADIHDMHASLKGQERMKAIAHPGVGELGKFHVKQRGEQLKDGEMITFALAGNQNCGKTTLFNQLTGSSHHVRNFPGVTVDR